MKQTITEPAPRRTHRRRAGADSTGADGFAAAGARAVASGDAWRRGSRPYPHPEYGGALLARGRSRQVTTMRCEERAIQPPNRWLQSVFAVGATLGLATFIAASLVLLLR